MTAHRFLFLCLLIILTSLTGVGQTTCNTPGQNPSTAFPVCGTGSFVQTSVNLCGGRKVPNPKCPNSPLTDINPYWYKFTCFKDGTLGFTINPNSPTSDYDWQVFDITNRNPDDVFTDVNMSIACNWSERFGLTGTNTTAANLFECEGPVPQFSKMPVITAGRTYLLLVSHFTNTQAGYKLDFGGGTAVITDTARPQMVTLGVGCGGSQFYLKLNKKMKCSSIAANGSDWEFVGGNVPIASATGVGCAGGFETDSILITTSGPVPTGIIALSSKKGTDGNTMLDLCDQPLPEGQTLVVNVLPASPSVVDSVRPVSCMPSELEIVLDAPVSCNSIAANGSDFEVTGPAPVTVSGATAGNCINSATKTIKIQLAGPLRTGGIYRVAVKKGSDGNTLLNPCAKETLEGSGATVLAYDTVSAKIDFSISSNCKADTVRFSNAGGNGINQWAWEDVTHGGTSIQPNFTRIYTTLGNKEVKLRVSNGVCSMEGWAVINLSDVRVTAAFEYPAYACPEDTVRLLDKSTGPVANWFWNFGNGSTFNGQNPPLQLYRSATALSAVPVVLVVVNQNGCTDTVVHRIQVPNNCYIAVATGFTPNGDGLNDYLYPINAWKAENLHFRVYNRYGQLMWETRDWTRKWDGRVNGQLQQTGTFVWHLQYTLDGRQVSQQGTSVLIR